MKHLARHRSTLLAALALGFAIGSLHAQSPAGPYTFRFANDYQSGTAPRAITLGHFVADAGLLQHLDLIMASSGQNRLDVWRGNGRGEFAGVRTLATGATPVALASADLNGDGQLDVVAANFDGNSISTFLGDGAGAFTAQPEFAVAPQPSAIALADFDGNGLIDALITSQSTDAATLYSGDGLGSFVASPTQIAVGLAPVQVVSGDLDGDGDRDAIVVNSLGATVSILRGDGAGGFARNDLPTAPRPVAIALGDFDRDARVDFALVHRDDDLVSHWRGDGAGGFVSAGQSSVGQSPTAIAAGDADADGDLDLVITNSLRGNATTLYNDGNRGFPAAAPIALGTREEPSAIAFGDLDNDSRADLVIAAQSTNRITVHLQDPFRANRIVGLEYRRGSHFDGAFVDTGWSWDTFNGRSGNDGYHLGVSLPAVGGPLLNNLSTTTVDLRANASYYLYLDDFASHGPAAEFEVTWGSNVIDEAVFAAACELGEQNVTFYRHSGSRKIELRTTGIVEDRLGSGAFASNGVRDYVLELTVLQTEPTATPQRDLITSLSLIAGDYSSLLQRDFVSQASEWDTRPGRTSFLGMPIGVALASDPNTLLNCADSTVTLLPGLEYVLFCDGERGDGSVVRVTVTWASGRSDQAEFFVGCSEATPITDFVRATGDPTIQLGRPGVTSSDRVGRDALLPNTLFDHVFSLRMFDAEPTVPPRVEDHCVALSLRAGSFGAGAFVFSGRAFDTQPGRSGSNGHNLGITDPSVGAALRNCDDTRVTLPSGRYYAYADTELALGTAVEVTVVWAERGLETAVFEVGATASATLWNRLLGSENIRLGGTGLQLDRIWRDGLVPNGGLDHVLDLQILSQGYVAFGQGCPGSRGVPRLRGTDGPQIGRPFALDLDRLAANSTVFVALGFETSLPLDLLGAFGCTLYTQPLLTTSQPTGDGDAVRWTFTMPSDPGSLGLAIVNQGFVVDLPANALGVTFTNGGFGRISL